ncbi:MAG: hypothetical protein KKE16_01090 [Firmicutes bacterium]|nr:hypothetical protein [Bacillota bacterium]
MNDEKTRNAKTPLIDMIIHWRNLLLQSGINSKGKVLDEMNVLLLHHDIPYKQSPGEGKC